MTTLAAFRQQQLNVDLGLTSATYPTGDEDLSFGSTADRNRAISLGIARMWPIMGRLIEESATPSPTALEYTLATIWDVETVDLLESSYNNPTDKGDNFRHLRLETTVGSPVSRLRMVQTFGTGTSFASMRVIGYVPYKSAFTGDSDTLDLPAEYEWIAAAGARAEVFRRQWVKRANYERFNVQSRDNDVTMGDMAMMYQMAEREFEDAREQHKRGFVTGHTFRPLR